MLSFETVFTFFFAEIFVVQCHDSCSPINPFPLPGNPEVDTDLDIINRHFSMRAFQEAIDTALES